MDLPPPSQGSHLFTLRIWAEAVGVGQIEWRGRLQHVLSGEVRYFRDWATLVLQLEELLARVGDPAGPGDGGPRP